MENCKVRLEVFCPEAKNHLTILVPLTLTFQKVASLLADHLGQSDGACEKCCFVLSKTGKFLSGEMLVGDSHLRNGDELVMTLQ